MYTTNGRMTFKEYLNKYRITVEEFAVRSKLSSASIWHYFSGRRRPTQKTAERIEKMSDGLVTVMELRGKDATRKD